MSKRKPNGTFEENNEFGKGRPQIPEDLKEARKLNRDEVERVINKFLQWSLQELIEYCKDSKNPVFECLIASILGKAIHQGDHQRLDFVLSVLRLKPKDGTEPDKPNNIHKQVVDMINQIEHKNGVLDAKDKEISEEKS